MKYILLLLFCLSSLSLTSFSSEDWGRTGHRVTGEVAEKHLNKKARRAIDKLLGGQSLAFVSTYADEIRSDDAYRSYGPWHYVNFPFDKTYDTHPKSEKGDLIMAIKTCVSVLKSDTSTKEEKVFHLKLLVHFVGDLHQPLHVGKAADKGANDFQVEWFNEGTNLHSVWDTKMIESYNMAYSELAANTARLSDGQLQLIKSGDVHSWMAESRALCLDIYANTKIGEKLSYRYMYKYVDVARSQMQKGGIRLAVLLNDIFG
ncbi:MAG: S1/P1 nuclease [Bacteroidota bacterium]